MSKELKPPSPHGTSSGFVFPPKAEVLMLCFEFDWCFITVDPDTEFATVRDIWDGLVMAVFDSLDEALEYCAG